MTSDDITKEAHWQVYYLIHGHRLDSTGDDFARCTCDPSVMFELDHTMFSHHEWHVAEVITQSGLLRKPGRPCRSCAGEADFVQPYAHLGGTPWCIPCYRDFDARRTAAQPPTPLLPRQQEKP